MYRAVILGICLVVLTATSGFAQTTIEWWQFWTDPEIKPTIQAMVRDFEKQNPDIKVKLTDLTWANGHEKLAIAFASGSAPDVVELGSDWIAQFAANGKLADLSAHVTPDSNAYDGWSLSTYEGKVYARPWILGTRVLYINLDLLNKAGFGDDAIPVSTADLMYLAKEISNLGRNTYGWGSNTAEKHRLYKKFLPFLWSYNGQILTDDNKSCVLASDRAVKALGFYKKLHDSCGYVADQRGIEDAFLAGKIGFIMSGDWLLKRIRHEKRKIRFATSLVPGHDPFSDEAGIPAMYGKVDPYPGRSFLGGEFLAANAGSSHQEAATKLIDFICNPANQLRFCKANFSANPSSREAQEDAFFQADPHLATFVRQMKLTKHPPVVPDWVYIEDELENAVEKVVFDNALPGETLYETQKKINQQLAH